MDNKDIFQEEEFSLEDIINEFSDHPIAPEAAEAAPTAEEVAEEPAAAPAEDMAATKVMPQLVIPAEEAEAPTEENSDATVRFTPVSEETETPVSTDGTVRFTPVSEDSETPVSTEGTIRIGDLSAALEAEGVSDITGVLPQLDLGEETEQAEDSEEASESAEDQDEAPEETEETPVKPPIPFSPRAALLEMKHKLVQGPEKRYYDLSEIGLGKLQVAIFLNVLIVFLCVAATTMFAMDMVPERRLKLVIFSQVLALLGSGLLGCFLMMDSITDLFRGKFTLDTLLTMTFFACCADAFFCLKETRIPCCAAFSLEMTLALWARYHRRSTEMAQMDTLRKAVRLHSIVKSPDYYEGKAAYLKGNGDVDDFTDTYSKATGPEKLQSVYAFLSLILCLGIATVAGLRHTPSLAIQVLANALLAAAPASYFVTLTRPAALLQRRLHMVGSVICGWQGVKKLCGKGVFPLRDSDLFPQGAIKLNGIKYYSDREPEEVVSYTASLVIAAGGALVGVFRNLLAGRDGTEYPVVNYQEYGKGGIGGEVNGEPVLVGSLNFLQEMGVEIPSGTMVNQAVYAAIDGQLCAVVAVNYAKMRSAAAGLVSVFGSRRLTPVLLASNFMMDTEFLRTKFSINTRRLVCPEKSVREELLARQADPEADVLALSTKDDLISAAYAVTGAKALRTACRWGMAIHLIGGVLGMLIMLALAYLGNTELLTPSHVLAYQLVWMLPGLLVTEWTRTV